MYKMKLQKRKQCIHCHKWLSDKSALRKHINAIHLKIRNVKCNYCEKRFNTNQQKRVHMARKSCLNKLTS